MKELIQAAQEYLTEYRLDIAAAYLASEFKLTEEYAKQICVQVQEQMEFAYCGA